MAMEGKRNEKELLTSNLVEFPSPMCPAFLQCNMYVMDLFFLSCYCCCCFWHNASEIYTTCTAKVIFWRMIRTLIYSSNANWCEL